MSEPLRHDELEGIELERRVRLLEGDSADQMMQPNLPVRDVVWLIVAMVSASLVLLWWAL